MRTTLAFSNFFHMLLMFFLFTGNLYSQQFQWVKVFDSNGYSIITDFDIDSAGNIYTIGIFDEYTDFNPDPSGNFTLYNDEVNSFIAKLDVNGDFVWAKQIRGQYSDVETTSIVIDEQDNIIIGGKFNHTVNFGTDTNPYNMTAQGYPDAFICKYDSDANLIWAKQFNTSEEAYINELYYKNSGIYVAGAFLQDITFDANMPNATIQSQGEKDIFFAKFDTNGNFLWGRGVGSPHSDEAHAITVDDDANVYITGGFWGTVDFDPGNNYYYLTSAGYQDIFIAKYDAAGNFVFAKALAGNLYQDIGRGIELDNDGNIYLTGSYRSTVDFDPGSGVYNLTSFGDSDIFIAKYSSQGDFIWAKSIGGLAIDSALDLSVSDVQNGVFVTGYFQRLVDFDPGTGIHALDSNGGYDIFIEKLDLDGNFEWAGNIGGDADSPAGDVDAGRAVLVNEDEVFFAGNFQPGDIDFDITSSEYIYSNINTNKNAFLCKYLDVELNAIKNNKRFKVNFYPNPVTDKIVFDIDLPVVVRVYDTSGKIVFHKKINKRTGFDFSYLQKGIYFIRFESNQTIISRKFLKK